MIDFLQLLIQRKRSDLESQSGEPTKDAAAKESLSSLLLAESALNKISLCQSHPQHPLQVAVIGPTQVGKSSMVNLLLGTELTEASAMAGFTVHCQGYSIGDTSDQNWAKSYFEGIDPQSQSALDRQVLNEYSLTRADNLVTDSTNWQGTVVWDTPDFDSVDSFEYRLSVLRATALADLVVFTVSREKYADKTVWAMLSLLTELSTPVVMVMNKTPPEFRQELSDSVQNKFQRLMAGKPAVELPLYFINDYQDGPSAGKDSEELTQLRVAIDSLLQRPDAATLQMQSRDYMSAFWSQWTAPLVQEHQLQVEWKNLVDSVTESLVTRYQSEYLDSSRHKETFQLALAELLALLEVPGMAKPLTQIRSVVTWPMRKLIATATDKAGKSATPEDDRSEERRLLEELAEHGLARLSVRISEQAEHALWWSEVDNKLSLKKPDLLQAYDKGLDNYQTLLQVEIERAAQSLYKNLQDQPATLNGLRAARVTADAAAVVLAVKSGGLGAADLVIAPAMLSLTSMLTEGALGQYMQKVQSDLRAYQKKEIASLMSRKLRLRLYPLATDSGRSAKISTTQLQNAAEQLGLSMPELAIAVDHSSPGEPNV